MLRSLTMLALTASFFPSGGGFVPQVTVQVTPVPGSSEREVRGDGIVHAPIGAVRAVVTDFEHFPGLIPYVAEVRVLSRTERDAHIYQREHAPLLTDYDEVLALHIEHDLGDLGPSSFVATWDAVRDAKAPLLGDAVRVQVFSGRWELSPDGPNQTRMHLVLHADPGSDLPSWTSQLVSRTAFPLLFHAVEEAARQHPG
jgi:ribosome-associated toxin RatA of RatAB toxin-antitoxin module